MVGRSAGGDNCAGDPDISRGVTMRWAVPHPPAVAAETLPTGGDQQHELRPSPVGRSAIPTARTPSDRCRRPPHRPNHHRAGAAAGCAAIPSVAPQRSPRGRRVSRAAAKRTTGAVDSRNPTIEPPMWSTLPPPFTAGSRCGTKGTLLLPRRHHPVRYFSATATGVPHCSGHVIRRQRPG